MTDNGEHNEFKAALRRLNQKFEVPDSEGSRTDQRTGKLGKNLATQEQNLYRILSIESKNGFVSTEKLYKELYGIDSVNASNNQAIWQLIVGIRQKLGERSVIAFGKKGYITIDNLIKLSDDDD